MGSDFTINMNEYLPLRDLVFNTLRQAILKGEAHGNSACGKAGGFQNAYS